MPDRFFVNSKPKDTLAVGLAISKMQAIARAGGKNNDCSPRTPSTLRQSSSQNAILNTKVNKNRYFLTHNQTRHMCPTRPRCTDMSALISPLILGARGRGFISRQPLEPSQKKFNLPSCILNCTRPANHVDVGIEVVMRNGSLIRGSASSRRRVF